MSFTDVELVFASLGRDLLSTVKLDIIYADLERKADVSLRYRSILKNFKKSMLSLSGSILPLTSIDRPSFVRSRFPPDQRAEQFD